VKKMENKISEQTEEIQNKGKKENIAVIRIRGNVTIKGDFTKTLQMLRLYKRNYCVVVPKNSTYMGMIEKVKDHVTWGEIDENMLTELQEKRASRDKKFYRLNSPKGGLRRRGIKASFNKAGSLGYRGDKINDLIKKMI